ncbi:MAG: hypothetical protein C7B45_09970 [Sulfobacillus acidophilus]|uniref:Uncharacterized protein n=1 Tax=Sulfobacillus acidophilus TaxID=53633 RepID=A0A2T2WHD6_9FIRM|nr:MAG: hypothetical protein C7B45_09970 [Sulfobacillus acidophilus]
MSALEQPRHPRLAVPILWRGLASLLLFGIAAIHFTLFLRTVRFDHVLAALFLIAVLGSLVAAVGVIRDARLWGWLVGFIVAAGAAVIRVLMTVYQRFDFFLMRLGRPAFHGFGSFGGLGSGSFPGYSRSFPAVSECFPYGGFAGIGGFASSSGFPGLYHPGGFAASATSFLMPLAIAIEVVFVAIAVYVLYLHRKSRPSA